MNEILIFTLNAIVMYFVADWIVRRIEMRRGEVLKQRQAVFFVIILVLCLVSFQLLRAFSISGGLWTVEPRARLSTGVATIVLVRPQLGVKACIEAGKVLDEPV